MYKSINTNVIAFILTLILSNNEYNSSNYYYLHENIIASRI